MKSSIFKSISTFSKVKLASTIIASTFLIGLLFFVSCNKESDMKPAKGQTEQTEKTLTSCDEEFETVVNTAALGVIELAKSSSFRNTVHSKVAEQFDGDDEVLLKTLNGLVSNLSENMRQSAVLHKDNIALSPNLVNYKNFQTYTTSEKLSSVVTGYSNCGKTRYVQIYIPCYDEVDLSSVPVVVIGYEEPEDCTIPGYQIQPDGSVKVINVDEAFACDNLVWVVSVNERVDALGAVSIKTVDDANIQDGDVVGLRVNDKEIKVDSVRISDKKECWLCGKAEVSFVSLQATGCAIAGNAFLGQDFISIGKSDLDKWKNISTSNGHAYMALSPENPLNDGECMGFLLYECDNDTNNNEKTWTYWTCASGGSVTLTYFSKNSPYGGSGIGRHCYASFGSTTSWTQLPIFFSWNDADLRLEGRKVN
jgi:hypothetical protein